MFRTTRRVPWAGLAVVGAILALTPVVAADSDDLARALMGVSGRAYRAHVEFLADDLMEGRDTGSRGYDVAALYVATQLESMGVAPGGGNGSYFQPVPLREGRLLESKVQLTRADGTVVDLALGQDYVQGGSTTQPESQVQASVVFAGFGVTAPELGYDDYKGLDVRGKIVALLTNAPPQFPSDQRAHFSSAQLKAENAAKRGAVGVLAFMGLDDQKRRPWERMLMNDSSRSMRWLRPDGSAAGQVADIKGTALLSPKAAGLLFTGSKVPLDKVYAQAAEGKPVGFALSSTVSITSKSEQKPVASANVVGLLEGSDPALRGTSVVYSTHLDHVGFGAEVDGDKLYNGAYDNASGTAVILEVARALASLRERPRRSVVFVFVTAEEEGLLGSDYFANHPTAGAGQMVANVNVDMPLFLYPLADVVGFGSEHSSLGDVVAKAAQQAGFGLTPDPMPAENLFIRSDQYSFVRRGVPAVFLVPGFRSADPAVDSMAAFQSFLQKNYHMPSDDLARPMDLPSAERFIRANVLLGHAVASDPQPPRWKPEGFFGKTFGRASK